jgi:bifunctional ADP-heptose synthase (sugar kinase/adenylyltransferase)
MKNRNYMGEKKKQIINNKLKEKNKDYSVIIFDWIEGVLTKTEYFFETIEEAKKFVETQTGDIKIYNQDKQVVHSEKKEKKYAKIKHKEDEDSYA